MTQFEFGGKLRLLTIIMALAGAVLFAIGWATYGGDSHDEHHATTEVAHTDTHGTDAAHATEGHGEDAAHAAHSEHHENQKNNRPYSALYLAAFFTMAISLGAGFFMAIQHAASVGWSISVIRIMEAMVQYLPIGGAIIIAILVMGVLHQHHIFHWMDPQLIDPESDHFDKLIAGKSAWLNGPRFIICAIVYVVGWTFFTWKLRSLSRKQDDFGTFDHTSEEQNKHQIKLRNLAAGFLVFFAVTSSTMAWDWIMSIDPHWFSTLFGWYTFSSYLVSAVSMIAIIAIYLKGKGYLPAFNDNHQHDLAKFMFGFSIFWSYLWVSQFLLIWYANIPEEVTYYMQRFDEFKLPFLGMLGLNLVLPLLILINSDFKRIPFLVVMAGVIILLGHYTDMFVMIMPGSVGQFAGFGLLELGALLFFLGLFLYITFAALTKADLEAKGNAYWHESEVFVY